MKVHDRGNHWHIYSEVGYGFTINNEYIDGKGVMNGWELSVASDRTYTGETVEEFIDLLKRFIKELKLSKYKKATKDLIVIYTDNLTKIKGFFKDYITLEFNTIYIQILEFFEFREINKWKELTDANEIAAYAQYLINTVFIPNKYWYLTPNQIPRRAIAKACNDDTASKIFPINYEQYLLFRKALFGGICYVPYKNLVVEEPLICLDLTSAYIYDLLIEKHCVSRFVLDDENNWEYYVDSTTKTSLGLYEISYTCSTNKIHCFKDIEGRNFEIGTHTVATILTSVDLKTFMDLVNITDIKCKWLYTCNLDNLPKYMLDELVKQYIKKVDLKGVDEEAYNLQKPVVNGIYGDCIRDYSTEVMFYDAKRKPSVAPQWGIWCTSYAKKNLLKLATKVEGWVYSDTDSIYCFDNEYNRKLVKEYNAEVKKNLLKFCGLYGYDYSKLKDLGTFKVEKTIRKFRAINQKLYMYETTDGKFKLTAAGLDQSTIEVSSEMFNQKRIDWGTRTFKFATDDGYYELQAKGLDAKILSIIQASTMKEQY